MAAFAGVEWGVEEEEEIPVVSNLSLISLRQSAKTQDTIQFIYKDSRGWSFVLFGKYTIGDD